MKLDPPQKGLLYDARVTFALVRKTLDSLGEILPHELFIPKSMMLAGEEKCQFSPPSLCYYLCCTLQGACSDQHLHLMAVKPPLFTQTFPQSSLSQLCSMPHRSHRFPDKTEYSSAPFYAQLRCSLCICLSCYKYTLID